jgi:hypothetical protein
VLSCLFFWCPQSLFINREDHGAITILVRSTERCPELHTGGTFHRNPPSLAYSTRIPCSRCCTSSRFCSWARLGPTVRSSFDGEPYGSRIDKPLSISWFNSEAFLFPWLCLANQAGRVLSIWSLEVVLSWRSSLSDVRFFEKSALTECSPRASCFLEQIVGGSWIFSCWKKLKTSSEDMYLAALEHMSGFFSIEEEELG